MENKDEKLWKIAKRRADFKKHLATYIVINLFLWALWLFTVREDFSEWQGIPWPAWCTLGWGVGLFFDFYSAYFSPDKNTLAEKEYEKLLREKEKGKL